MRFPEFDEEWEVKKIGDIAEKIGDGLHGTPTYVDESDYYFINGNNLVNGKIEINSNTKKIASETFVKNDKKLNSNTLLISINGTIGNIARYNNEKVMLGKSVGYYNFNNNSNFLYFTLQNKSVQFFFNSELTGSTIKNLSLKTLRDINIPLPSDSEQDKISLFLSKVEERIATQSKIIEGLKSRKIIVLKQIFDKTLKFKNDEGNPYPDWTNKTLGDISERIVSKNKEGNKNVLTISAQHGLISQLEYFNKAVSAKDVTGYYLLERDDFAYNKSYSAGYPMGAIKRLIKYDKGVVSTLYICFRFNNMVSKTFMEQYFEAGIQNIEIEKIAQEGARNHGLLNVGISDFFNISFILPSFSEQKKIADFLSVLDNSIKREITYLRKLEEQKKFLLRNLFV